MSEPGTLLSHREFPVDDNVWFDVESVAKGEDAVAKKAIEWIQSSTYKHDILSKPMTRIYPNPG